jgi:hypothetical protein
MRYQMWHAETRNLMEDFDTEAEALEAARVYLTPDEHGDTVDVLLVINDDAGVPTSAIEGDELLRRAGVPTRVDSRRTV